jgi:hypothetical protein
MAYPPKVRYSIIPPSSSMPRKQSPALTFIYRNAVCRFQISRLCSFYRHDPHRFNQPHNYIMKYVNDTPKVKSYQSLCDYLLHKQKIPLDIPLQNFTGTLIYIYIYIYIYERCPGLASLNKHTLNFRRVSPISLTTTSLVVTIPCGGIRITIFMIMPIL